jgi:AraC family transcriptional regulator, activator of mtrCDE
MTGQSPELDTFLEAVDIGVEAFGICEIGRQFSLRCDPFDSVIVHFVLRGEGFFDCCYGRFPLAQGMAVIVPRKLAKSLSGTGPVEHVKDASPLCTAERGLVRFRATEGAPALVLGCAQLRGTIGQDLPLFNRVERPIFEASRDPLLRGLFATMFEELRGPRLGTRAFVSALMKQVLIVMLRSQPDDNTATLLMTNVRFARAVAAVLDSPEASHTVDSLAAMAAMSRSRFIHHFTAAYDCSPRAFVQASRLAAAARLLRGSELPVKSVANSVGYASRSQFSRAFQAKYGLSPSDFRHRHHREPAEPIPLPSRTAGVREGTPAAA